MKLVLVVDYLVFIFLKFCDWTVEVKEGNIVSIVKEEDWQGNSKRGHIIDYGEAVVMPGLIDV